MQKALKLHVACLRKQGKTREALIMLVYLMDDYNVAYAVLSILSSLVIPFIAHSVLSHDASGILHSALCLLMR